MRLLWRGGIQLRALGPGKKIIILHLYRHHNHRNTPHYHHNYHHHHHHIRHTTSAGAVTRTLTVLAERRKTTLPLQFLPGDDNKCLEISLST